MAVIEAEHVGDGLYMMEKFPGVAIAVNHHTNIVAYIDIDHIDRAIAYLQKVKEKYN